MKTETKKEKIKRIEKIVEELEKSMDEQIEKFGKYSQNYYEDWNNYKGILYYLTDGKNEN